MQKIIKGIMPALVTPLKLDETVNVPALHKLVGHLKSQKADGFYIAGATGEGLLLSVEARKMLIDESVSAIGKDLLKIVHVSDMNFSTTLSLAKYAEHAGADAISVIPPLYFTYSENDLYEYYKRIAAEVDIPVMLYYTPAANVELSTDLFVRLSEIDNITSVKWTMKDYYKMIDLLIATEGRLTTINGPDEMLISGLAAGAAGGIGTTYNVMLPMYKEIYASYHSGDMAHALEIQKKADKIVKAIIKRPTIPSTKVVLEEMGFEVGYAAFPMHRFTKEERAEIIRDVRVAGFDI